MTRTAPATCPFCEATCGVIVETDGDQVVAVRGDKEDSFSRGYICPKAHGLKSLQRRAQRRAGHCFRGLGTVAADRYGYR